MSTATTMEPNSVFAAPATGPSPEAASANAPAEGSGVAPAGAPSPGEYEAPILAEIAGGKYKTLADLGKGYSESSRVAREHEAALAAERERVAGLLGAPKNEKGEPAPYEFTVPEGVTLDLTDPRIEGLQEFARQHDLAPGIVNDLVNSVGIPWLAAEEQAIRDQEAARDQAIDAYFGGGQPITAEARQAKLSEIASWVTGFFPGDPGTAQALLEIAGKSAGGVIGLDKLRLARGNVAPGSGSVGGPALDATGYQAILAEPGWQFDTAKSEAVAAYLRKMHPDV